MRAAPRLAHGQQAAARRIRCWPGVGPADQLLLRLPLAEIIVIRVLLSAGAGAVMGSLSVCERHDEVEVAQVLQACDDGAVCLYGVFEESESLSDLLLVRKRGDSDGQQR